MDRKILEVFLKNLIHFLTNYMYIYYTEIVIYNISNSPFDFCRFLTAVAATIQYKLFFLL